MNVNPEDVLMQGYVLATGENIGYRMGYKRFYFVLTDCLYYYETKESFESRSKPVGKLPLEAFSIAKNETRGRFQLAILAFDLCGRFTYRYPYSVEFNLDSAESMKAWLDGFDRHFAVCASPLFKWRLSFVIVDYSSFCVSSPHSSISSCTEPISRLSAIFFFWGGRFIEGIFA